VELKATRLETQDGVGTLWLNRPERMNAWTGRMHGEYRWGIEQLDQDPEVGVIVVTGVGKGFCVGADSQALEGHSKRGSYDPGTPALMAEPGYGVAPEFDAPFAYHFGLSKPVIAAINGPAAGVGLALACYADLRFAVPGVKLTTAHGKLNLPAELGLSWLLPRIIGLTRANDLLLTSRVFSSDEAYAMGMINELFEPERLLDAVYDYARALIANVSPNSLKQTRRQVYRDLHRDIASSVRAFDEMANSMMGEADYREGVAAFLEKRPPKWGPRQSPVSASAPVDRDRPPD
jgi:enoyl-CoA hydratase/carnithine racemase